MRILVWYVHGGWMSGFLSGGHEYVIPHDGRSLPPLPDGVRLVDPAALAGEHVEAVVLQRTEELELAERLLGRVPGRDVPAVFVEHNTPKRRPVDERHPLADRADIPVVHVTHFNRLVWDTGDAPTRVIEHGVPDPGPTYTGEDPVLGVVVNEPVRRWRVTGTDLLPEFSRAAPLRCFGIGTELLPGSLDLGGDRLLVGGDLPTPRLHSELARCRAYLHPFRWTSLGLSLLEAMTIGMPVLALATTEAVRAVPREAGVLSTDPSDLVAAAERLIADPAEAISMGSAARAFALERYGLARFLRDWDAVLEETADAHALRVRTRITGGAQRRPDTASAVEAADGKGAVG